jgi:hypothetical protein
MKISQQSEQEDQYRQNNEKSIIDKSFTMKLIYVSDD